MHYVPVLKDLKKLFPEFESDLLLKTYLMYDLNGEKIHWEFSDVPHLFISHSKEKKKKKTFGPNYWSFGRTHFETIKIAFLFVYLLS